MASIDQSEVGSKMKNTLMFFGSAIIFILMINTVFAVMNWLKNRLPTEVQPPVIDEPIQQPTNYNKQIEILESPYIPSPNPFADEQYALAPKIVYRGSFSGVTLHVNGQVLGAGRRFLLLNFNNETGIINGVRKSPSQVDISATSTKGGAFTQENGISTSINLMGVELGASKSDFEETGKGTRVFQFIKSEQPSDVAKILAIPFNENGQYGSAIVNSLIIEYSCQTGKQCIIEKCDTKKKATQCLTEQFGEPEMLNWRKRTGL